MDVGGSEEYRQDVVEQQGCAVIQR
jgi:hypothetical protein